MSLLNEDAACFSFWRFDLWIYVIVFSIIQKISIGWFICIIYAPVQAGPRLFINIQWSLSSQSAYSSLLSDKSLFQHHANSVNIEILQIDIDIDIDGNNNTYCIYLRPRVLTKKGIKQWLSFLLIIFYFFYSRVVEYFKNYRKLYYCYYYKYYWLYSRPCIILSVTLLF